MAVSESETHLSYFARFNAMLKAKIFVPMGINLIGVMDEYDVIPPNHVFFQWSNGETTSRLPSHHRVVVYRNPCLHPGDIQVLTTCDHPKLRHLTNVLVFSSKGRRPNPNELSGGDLDGDIYSIIGDPLLLPRKNYQPMEYSAPRKQSKVPRKVKINHVQNFFIDYMKNDNLGVIANAHVVFADKHPQGAKSRECLELARLHSVAVGKSIFTSLASLALQIIFALASFYFRRFRKNWRSSSDALVTESKLLS